MGRIWIPAKRFTDLLDERGVTATQLGDTGRKRVAELYSGRQECLSLEAADRILTDLDLVYLLHLPKEAGGLGDLYFETDPYVPSWIEKKKAPRPGRKPTKPRRKYRTPEEAIEGNRRRSRENARRLGKRCKCGTPILDRSETCRDCHMAGLEPPAHGTISRYASRTYRCRCELCRAASTRYHRERRRMMRDAYLAAQVAA